MFKSITSVLVIGTLMTGCISGNFFKAETSLNDVSVTTSITLAQEECYRSDQILRGDMTSDQYLVAVALKGLRDVALSAQGKPKCEITTVYDSQIAEVEAKTGMVTGGVEAIAGVVTNGIIGASVVGLVGNSGNDYKTTGFGADIVSYDKSNNDLANDSFNPETNTTTTSGVAE